MSYGVTGRKFHTKMSAFTLTKTETDGMKAKSRIDYEDFLAIKIASGSKGSGLDRRGR